MSLLALNSQEKITIIGYFRTFRDGPLENLWGGGGGRSTKKIFAQGKIE